MRNFRFVRPLVFLFIITGLLFVGASAKAVYRETSEQKVWNALTKLSKAQSLVYEGSANYYGKISNTYKQLLASGTLKKNSSKYQSFALNFKGGNETFTSTESQSWFSLLTKSSDKNGLVFGLETRSVGGNFYAAMTRAENLPLGLSEYKDMWVQFNAESFFKELGLDKSFLEKREFVQNSTPEEDQKVKDLVAKSNVFKVVGSYRASSGGVLFDVYNFTINKKNLNKLVNDLMNLSGHPATIKQSSGLDKSLAQVKSISGKAWVSRKDGLPYRLSLDLFGNQPKEKTSLNITFKNFNLPVVVSEPSSYLTFEEFLSKLFPSPQVLDITTSSTIPIGI